MAKKYWLTDNQLQDSILPSYILYCATKYQNICWHLLKEMYVKDTMILMKYNYKLFIGVKQNSIDIQTYLNKLQAKTDLFYHKYKEDEMICEMICERIGWLFKVINKAKGENKRTITNWL